MTSGSQTACSCVVTKGSALWGSQAAAHCQPWQTTCFPKTGLKPTFKFLLFNALRKSLKTAQNGWKTFNVAESGFLVLWI